MRIVQLWSVPCGTTFKAFGDEFVALGNVYEDILAIRKEIWRKAPFDVGGGNDLRTASVGKHLAEYETGLVKAGAEKYLRSCKTDLRATDGTREYGFYPATRVSLLTLEQYGEYQHFIPDVDGWWWLATPWQTPGQKRGNSAYGWLVGGEGGIQRNITFTSLGIRPVLFYDSSLIVAIPDDGAMSRGM